MAGADMPYEVGETVPFRISAGFIAAGFFVSLIGSTTTVELLHRIANGRGWFHWFQLLACSVFMGLIGIWCMHFVGNHGIVLADGEPQLQPSYSPGPTVASAFIPILALFIGFLITDFRYKGKMAMAASMILSGITVGLAIFGMYYVSNVGVDNYNITIKPAYIYGAVIIAVVGSYIALASLFMLQQLWISTLWYRLICAILLAGAVAGMHFEASMGTSYVLTSTGDPQNLLGQQANAIIAIGLSVLAIPGCAVLAMWAAMRQLKLTRRAQQVVLACIRFDPDGRLMVTHEGNLPCQAITARHNHSAFQDDFNLSHPAFQWIFRISHCWDLVSRWIPAMRNHLGEFQQIISDVLRPARDGGAQDKNYSVFFREWFCVAAADLASTLNIDMNDLGTLFSEVMMTGTFNEASKNWLACRRMLDQARGDLESGTKEFATGQLLFLVKVIDRSAAWEFVIKGYRFIPSDKASLQVQMAQTLQVPVGKMFEQIARLRQYAFDPPTTGLTGTFMTCFAFRANFATKDMEVLVSKIRPFELPMAQLSLHSISYAQQEIMTTLHGKSVSDCLDWLSARISSGNGLASFLMDLRESIVKLLNMVPEEWFPRAVLSATPVKQLVLRPGASLDSGNRARREDFDEITLYVFHIMPNVHFASLSFPGSDEILEYVPLTFLKCLQQAIIGHSGHNSYQRCFESRFQREFATKLFGFDHTGEVEAPITDRVTSGPATPLNNLSRTTTKSGHLQALARVQPQDTMTPADVGEDDHAYDDTAALIIQRPKAALSPQSGVPRLRSSRLSGRRVRDSLMPLILTRSYNPRDSFELTDLSNGGIIGVSSEVTVESTGPVFTGKGKGKEASQPNSGPQPRPQEAWELDTDDTGPPRRLTVSDKMEARRLGSNKGVTTGQPSTAEPEEPTFFDELIKVTVAKWAPKNFKP